MSPLWFLENFFLLLLTHHCWCCSIMTLYCRLSKYDMFQQDSRHVLPSLSCFPLNGWITSYNQCVAPRHFNSKSRSSKKKENKELKVKEIKKSAILQFKKTRKKMKEIWKKKHFFSSRLTSWNIVLANYLRVSFLFFFVLSLSI